jgi:hypothetical protein
MTISLGIQMPASVTAQYLLEGAAYALEQCGLLLADANLLYRGGSNASTVVLAAFAREELGKYKILLKLRKEVLNGKHLTEKYVKTYCKDHEQKQKEGMASISLGTANCILAAPFLGVGRRCCLRRGWLR